MVDRIIKLIRFVVAWFRIPKGMYCYSGGRGTGRCPYWRKIEGRPYQADGWCDFLKKGDMEIAAETIWTVEHVGNIKQSYEVGDKILGTDLPGSSLLWDQCKECRIKENNGNSGGKTNECG